MVLGRIGHGKSTFLRYLRLVKAKDELKKYIQIDIDFLDRPTTRAEAQDYIFTQIERSLLDRYSIDIMEDGLVRGVLHFEIQRFKNTPAGKLFAGDPMAYNVKELEYIETIQRDRYFYIGRVLNHLRKGRGNSIALFFDNLDRRIDEIQEEAILRASAMAKDWSCLVFVCLRPSTFYRSKESGVLDSVAPKTFSVVSPRVDLLLRKRFDYARAIAEGQSHHGGPIGKDVTFDLPKVATFLNCCKASFSESKDSHGKELVALFESVSNGNMRELLKFVGQFIVSKHLDTKMILEKLDRNTYRIPVHQALRSLLYGDYMDYDPRKSIFINLFDLKRSDPQEHFSRFLALHYLARLAENSATRGYTPSEKAVQYLCQIGMTGDHARETIRFLATKRCIENRIPDLEINAESDIRLTSLGKYHVLNLSHSFQYIDAIIVDTPVLDSEMRKKIYQSPHDIPGRLERCGYFLEYLDDCSKALFDADAGHLWKNTKLKVKEDMRRVKASNAQHKRRASGSQGNRRRSR